MGTTPKTMILMFFGIFFSRFFFCLFPKLSKFILILLCKMCFFRSFSRLKFNRNWFSGHNVLLTGLICFNSQIQTHNPLLDERLPPCVYYFLLLYLSKINSKKEILGASDIL